MSRRRHSLDGTWRYAPQARVVLQPGAVLVETTEALPPGGEMHIPCNWQLGGLDNFQGRVRFTRSFDFDGLHPGEESVWLVFQGVDYFARVWLNGVLLGDHAGYFAPFGFDVSHAIREGENELVVDVTDPLEEPGSVWPDAKYLIKGILNHWDCRPGSWDLQTGQEKNCGGIWHSVYLETRPAAYLGHVRTATRLVPRSAPPGYGVGTHVDAGAPFQAMVSIDVEIYAPPGEYTLEAQIGDSGSAARRVTVTQPGQRHTLVVAVAEPRLWWTWDRGEPHLEQCTVRLHHDDQESDVRSFEIGLREVQLDAETGEWRLNRERLFLRGTNVVPTLWLGEYDAAMIQKDMDMLLAAHINAVRVCVHVNRDEFYTACDRAGILIWQDFALQWGYAPDQAVVQEAVSQIKEMVRLLAHHPSIAVWCCQNESTFHNKFIMDPVLGDAVAEEDTTRFIRPTSEFSEHFYGGWYYGDYRDYLTLPGTPILTEFGAQALPRVEEARRMGGDQWPPDWAKLAYHDFQYDQTFNVAQVPLGDSWEEFVSHSQAYQAEVLKFAIEHYRQAKYARLGGMFQFMFMDCWPSVTWSIVEYDRTPKLAYYTLQQVYQPVLIGWNQQRTTFSTGDDPASHKRPLTIVPWVVNDRKETLSGCTYTVTLTGDQWRQEWQSTEPFDVPADAVLPQAPRLDLADLPESGEYRLELTLLHEGQIISSNHYELKLRALPQFSVSVTL
ncbi:MAG: beta-galactosidase [Caldilineaceae bacterium]|nr:beta-galactosidase [Caldilineaceae bacterium]